MLEDTDILAFLKSSPAQCALKQETSFWLSVMGGKDNAFHLLNLSRLPTPSPLPSPLPCDEDQSPWGSGTTRTRDPSTITSPYPSVDGPRLLSCLHALVHDRIRKLVYHQLSAAIKRSPLFLHDMLAHIHQADAVEADGPHHQTDQPQEGGSSPPAQSREGYATESEGEDDEGEGEGEGEGVEVRRWSVFVTPTSVAKSPSSSSGSPANSLKRNESSSSSTGGSRGTERHISSGSGSHSSIDEGEVDVAVDHHQQHQQTRRTSIPVCAERRFSIGEGAEGSVVAIHGRYVAVRRDRRDVLEVLEVGGADGGRVVASFEFHADRYRLDQKEIINEPDRRGLIKKWLFPSRRSLLVVTKFFGVYVYDISTGRELCVKDDERLQSAPPARGSYEMEGNSVWGDALRRVELTACDIACTNFVTAGADGTLRFQKFSDDHHHLTHLCSVDLGVQPLCDDYTWSLVGHTVVPDLSISSAGRLVCVLIHQLYKEVRIYHWGSFKEVRRLRLDCEASLARMDPSGRLLLVTDALSQPLPATKVLAIKSGRIMAEVNYRLFSPCFSPCGRFLIAGCPTSDRGTPLLVAKDPPSWRLSKGAKKAPPARPKDFRHTKVTLYALPSLQFLGTLSEYDGSYGLKSSCRLGSGDLCLLSRTADATLIVAAGRQPSHPPPCPASIPPSPPQNDASESPGGEEPAADNSGDKDDEQQQQQRQQQQEASASADLDSPVLGRRDSVTSQASSSATTVAPSAVVTYIYALDHEELVKATDPEMMCLSVFARRRESAEDATGDIPSAASSPMRPSSPALDVATPPVPLLDSLGVSITLSPQLSQAVSHTASQASASSSGRRARQRRRSSQADTAELELMGDLLAVDDSPASAPSRKGGKAKRVKSRSGQSNPSSPSSPNITPMDHNTSILSPLSPASPATAALEVIGEHEPPDLDLGSSYAMVGIGDQDSDSSSKNGKRSKKKGAREARKNK
ncbi:unnamed protein product [Vitrella brassicaformis CCMP3155]|uniref:Uncharacterized protein n=3 Tax=Vitrella brassicaformis TaxID=1169539 RepID=A0A0G4EWS9_VITBC|nr:unnamed protein product [Vitrella brassicaformis CCMP3155]|eukprot:CEM03213.1 unnamed protein product [Vitrella brassicaformis CCMP3155]